MDNMIWVEKQLSSFQLNVKLEFPNTTLAILGPSGCGKSVLLHCICGLMKPDRGKIVLGGKVYYDSEHQIHIPVEKRNMGYLFQNFGLFPNLTVFEQVHMVSRKQIQPFDTMELLEKVGLSKKKDEYPNQLSGGEKQRLALSRVLALKASTFLLDEPFSALDFHMKQTLKADIKSIVKEWNIPMLLVTHDREEADEMAEYTALLWEGNVKAFGKKQQVLYHPSTMQSAKFLGVENFFPDESGGMIGVRSQHLQMIKQDGMAFVVVIQEVFEALMEYELRCVLCNTQYPVIAKIAKNRMEVMPKPQEKVTLYVCQADLLYFDELGDGL